MMPYQPYLGLEAHRRRGVVAVMVLAFLVTLLVFAALTVDVGAMYNTKADLQRTADAAALAAAARLSQYDDGSPVEIARLVAKDFTERNKVFGQYMTIDPNTDVVFGRANYDVDSNEYTFVPTELMPDAVEVSVRHTAESVNGSVSLYFARVFGMTETEMQASALAVMVPRDIAIVADLSGSHTDDSELFHYPLTEINLFDVWNALPGGADDVGACDNISCGSGQTCVAGACVASGPGAQSGPTWGYMDNMGFGTETVDPTYSPTADPGLIYLPYNVNWSNAQLTAFLTARGYNSTERTAIMSKTQDASGYWPYRVSVALGLANWNSGIAGGRWSIYGGSGGNNNSTIGSNELTWVSPIMGRTNSASSSIWLDYIDNYTNKTWSYMYSANSSFRYRFGVKTFINYLMERRVANSQTPELASTPHQPMQAVKDAVDYMMEVVDEMDSDDQVSLEIYGTTASHEVDLTHDVAQVASRLNQMQAGHYNSWTNTGAGIYSAIAELTSVRARGSARKMIVLLTDGNANCDAGNNCGSTEDQIEEGNAYTLEAAEAAAALGIRIVCVSVGADANTSLMLQVADIGQGEHFHASGTIDEYSAQLQEIFERIGGNRPVELIR